VMAHMQEERQMNLTAKNMLTHSSQPRLTKRLSAEFKSPYEDTLVDQQQEIFIDDPLGLGLSHRERELIRELASQRVSPGGRQVIHISAYGKHGTQIGGHSQPNALSDDSEIELLSPFQRSAFEAEEFDNKTSMYESNLSLNQDDIMDEQEVQMSFDEELAEEVNSPESMVTTLLTHISQCTDEVTTHIPQCTDEVPTHTEHHTDAQHINNAPDTTTTNLQTTNNHDNYPQTPIINSTFQDDAFETDSIEDSDIHSQESPVDLMLSNLLMEGSQTVLHEIETSLNAIADEAPKHGSAGGSVPPQGVNANWLQSL